MSSIPNKFPTPAENHSVSILQVVLTSLIVSFSLLGLNKYYDKKNLKTSITQISGVRFVDPAVILSIIEKDPKITALYRQMQLNLQEFMTLVQKNGDRIRSLDNAVIKGKIEEFYGFFQENQEALSNSMENCAMNQAKKYFDKIPSVKDSKDLFFLKSQIFHCNDASKDLTPEFLTILHQHSSIIIEDTLKDIEQIINPINARIVELKELIVQALKEADEKTIQIQAPVVAKHVSKPVMKKQMGA